MPELRRRELRPPPGGGGRMGQGRGPRLGLGPRGSSFSRIVGGCLLRSPLDPRDTELPRALADEAGDLLTVDQLFSD